MSPPADPASPVAPADATAAGFLAALHPGSTTLSPARDLVVGYDLEGRPLHWFDGGTTYKRSLASELFGRRTVGGARERWRVPAAAAAQRFEQALAVARAAEERLPELRVRGDAAALEARLARILAWTPQRLAEERQRFAAVYRPVSILPPDQYHSVVLQASFGCSWNRCTFCTFYQGRPFALRPVEEFERHVEAVQRFLGAAAAGRAGVFLADGNALVLSNARLRPLLAAATRAFPGRPVAGFVDVFGGERKPARDWAELRELGLARVAIGVETGHDPLLAHLNKPGSAAEAAAFVRLLKGAGLAVSLIFMVGVGGERFAAAHERDSLALLERLELGADDIVYLSPFVTQPGSAYAVRARLDGTAALAGAALEEQYQRLAAGARRLAPAARTALYHLDEFVY